MASAQSVSSGYTSVVSPGANAIKAAATGRWGTRSELSRAAGVKIGSGDFYCRALYKAGILVRRKVPREHASKAPFLLPYQYEYRLKGT